MKKQISGIHELSIGMSHSYKIAIEEGATIVRVGTGIFGARDYSAWKQEDFATEPALSVVEREHREHSENNK